MRCCFTKCGKREKKRKINKNCLMQLIFRPEALFRNKEKSSKRISIKEALLRRKFFSLFHFNCPEDFGRNICCLSSLLSSLSLFSPPPPHDTHKYLVQPFQIFNKTPLGSVVYPYLTLIAGCVNITPVTVIVLSQSGYLFLLKPSYKSET